MPHDPSTKARGLYGKVYHPLLNVPLPTVADLRSRCSDGESVEVLDAACQLAALRCQSFNHAKQAVQGYSIEPFIGVPVDLGPGSELLLCETDVIRALRLW